MQKQWLPFCISLVVLLMGIDWPAAQAAEVIGTDFDGVLYNLDLTTGAASNPRSTGVPSLGGLARSPLGTFYAHDAIGNMLYTIDAISGLATAVGFIGLDVTEGGLDFHPQTGTLYGVQTFGDDKLYTLDTATGQGTIIGTISTNADTSAMAFRPSDGTLFVLDTRNMELLEVDPNDASILSTLPLITATPGETLGNAAGMAFDPIDNTLYVADGGDDGTDRLYTVSFEFGRLLRVGDTGLPGGISGLAFVPEPGACLLFGLAAGTLFRRRRKN